MWCCAGGRAHTQQRGVLRKRRFGFPSVQARPLVLAGPRGRRRSAAMGKVKQTRRMLAKFFNWRVSVTLTDGRVPRPQRATCVSERAGLGLRWVLRFAGGALWWTRQGHPEEA